MLDMNKAFMNRFFRKVDGMVWDMMTGKIGYQQKDGIVTLDLNTDHPEMSSPIVNLFDDFGVAIPAFAQSTPIDQVSVGDLIYSSSSNRVMGWVIKKTEKQFRIMKPDGTCTAWNPPRVQMLGFDSGVMVLRSLLNMSGQDGLGQMQNMLMPMMAMGLGSDDMDSMIPLMLMSQGGMGGSAANNQNTMGGMMPMMMMMSMMKTPPKNIKSPFSQTNKKSNSFFDQED